MMLTARLCCLLALLMMLAAAAVPPPPAAAQSGATTPVAGKNGTKWALLVGVADYENDGVTDLEFTVRDVKAVSQALTGTAGFPADNVFTLTSDVENGPNRPTHLNVLKRLDMLAQRIGPNDTFVFYFSGHGYLRDNGRHFLGTVNADPYNLDTLQVSSIPLDMLRERMKKIQAKQVIFIIDACRNDPEKGKGEADNVRTESFSKDFVKAAAETAGGQAGTAVLFACGESERSYEWSEKQHGVFTYYLLDGLSGGRAADAGGQVTIASLAEYVQGQVARWAAQNNRRQRPDLHQSGAARIVLAERVRPSSATATAPATAAVSTPVDGGARPATAAVTNGRLNPKADLTTRFAEALIQISRAAPGDYQSLKGRAYTPEWRGMAPVPVNEVYECLLSPSGLLAHQELACESAVVRVREGWGALLLAGWFGTDAGARLFLAETLGQLKGAGYSVDLSRNPRGKNATFRVGETEFVTGVLKGGKAKYRVYVLARPR